MVKKGKKKREPTATVWGRGSQIDVIHFPSKIHILTCPPTVPQVLSASTFFQVDILKSRSLDSSSGSYVLIIFRAILPMLWVHLLKSFCKNL